jgi:hypothetical protein
MSFGILETPNCKDSAKVLLWIADIILTTRREILKSMDENLCSETIEYVLESALS